MSRGNWSVLAALAGLAALFCAAGFGAYYGSLYAPNGKDYQAVSGDQRTSQDYAGPSQSLRDISGLPGPVERAISNPRPSTGQDHEQRDLAAQEAAALWGFWMVLAAFATFVVTSFGTLLIWRQVSLTREAVEDTGKATAAMIEQNEISRQSTVLQFRPYMGTLGAALINPISQPAVIVDIKNFGQTPARIIAQDFRVVHFAREPNSYQFKRIFYRIPLQPTAHCDPGHTQSRTAIIDGPINYGNGDHLFVEFTQTYASFDGAVYWRRMSYRFDHNSTWVEKNKIRLDVHEIPEEDGEGHPPPSNVKEN